MASTASNQPNRFTSAFTSTTGDSFPVPNSSRLIAQALEFNKIPVHPLEYYPYMMAQAAKDKVGAAENSATSKAQIDHHQRLQNRVLGRAEWDQAPVAPSISGFTLSHATTTDYQDSVVEGEDEDEAGPKRKKMATPSVVSFNSSRDISQFVKDVHGR
jgi:hypothetical protein